MSDYRLWDIEDKDMDTAINCMQDFTKNYPDRMGSHHGVVYAFSLRPDLYVYRTKSGRITARGLGR